MPHFFEGLTDAYECRLTIFVTLQCCMYDISYTVDLFNSFVFISETELVIRFF
jgi:hypothetical protein